MGSMGRFRSDKDKTESSVRGCTASLKQSQKILDDDEPVKSEEDLKAIWPFDL